MEHLKSQEAKFKDLNRQLEFQVDELMEQLNTADEARKATKKDLKVAHDEAVSLGEQLEHQQNQEKKFKDLNR